MMRRQWHFFFFFFSSRRRHTRLQGDWSSDVCSSDLIAPPHDADEILLKVQAYVRAKLDADRARAEGLLDPLSGLYNPQGLARRARELGSHAFREHGALACVAVALDLEQGEAAVTAEETDGAAVVRCGYAPRRRSARGRRNRGAGSGGLTPASAVSPLR